MQVLNVNGIKFGDSCLISPTVNLVSCRYFRLNSNCVLFVDHSPKFSPPQLKLFSSTNVCCYTVLFTSQIIVHIIASYLLLLLLTLADDWSSDRTVIICQENCLLY